jgi:hypothetical protein
MIGQLGITDFFNRNGQKRASGGYKKFAAIHRRLASQIYGR